MHVKAVISGRLREIRNEIFGEHGGPELARRLGLPARTWYNYETGVTVPAEVLLGFIEQTGVNPIWLLTGEGPKFRTSLEDMVLGDLSPAQLIRRGLEKLEKQPHEVVIVSSETEPNEASGEFVAVDLVPLEALGEAATKRPVEGHILAYRQWIPHPAQTVAVQLQDDAMHPILPAGSVVAVDLAVREPIVLQGRLVAARTANKPMIRWLEISGRHVILRASQAGREFPLIPLELGASTHQVILGQVVWSWSRFAQS
jgi:SOS-response transcriptional repressor LexA